MPGSDYLVVHCGAILLIIGVLSLYNIMNPFSKISSDQKSSNFEKIVYIAGEMSLSLFIGYFITVTIQFIFHVLNFSFQFMDKFAFIASVVAFLFIYYRGKSHQNEAIRKDDDDIMKDF